jgi:DNA-binding IclR family transcriptional regulator
VQAENWEGTRWPLQQGASGHALLATWAPEDVAAFVDEHPEVPDLAERVADRPASGVWWSVGDYVEGLTSAAVPICNEDGLGIATVYAYGPSYRFPRAETRPVIEAALVDRAARIARAWSSRTGTRSTSRWQSIGDPLTAATQRTGA